MDQQAQKEETSFTSEGNLITFKGFLEGKNIQLIHSIANATRRFSKQTRPLISFHSGILSFGNTFIRNKNHEGRFILLYKDFIIGENIKKKSKGKLKFEMEVFQELHVFPKTPKGDHLLS